MGAGLSPEAILIVALIALGIWTGGKVVHGVEVGVHKAKCGVMHIVGKHCEPTPPAEQP